MKLIRDMNTIERNSGKLQISLPAQKPSALLGWLTEQLTILAEAFGEAMTAARLKVYAADLDDLKRSQLELAFSRARRELTFFPKIADLRKLAGGDRKEQEEAQAHKAWDVLLDFVAKWIQSDPHGCYGHDQGCRSCPPPQLEQRILDCARRLGGWRRLKTASEDDLPFLKKDFLQEYLSWHAIDRIGTDHMLAESPRLQLAASPQEQKPEPRPPVLRPTNLVEHKPVSEPLTPAQVQDRRQILRQQLEQVKQQKDTTKA